ncbi:unannotated protein [freshwater metagenome]|uniref:Unannotated protein n=1 Tax=freshwater metagenome TaxID=449393 RepID=A0A6J7HI60_9ZZZZ
MINARPAVGVATNWEIGSRNVSTADDGPRSETMSRTAFTVRSPWPKTPSRDTMASSAGKIDRTA